MISMKRVCLISTQHHNVGDDFVRAGIVWLLKQLFLEQELEVRVIHKHFPLTACGGLWEMVDQWTRRMPRVAYALSRVDHLLPLNSKRDAILNCDLLIQCGAPVYWNNEYSSCARTEWFGPLIDRRWNSVRERVPLLNLGAGSCLPLGSDGSEVWADKACKAFAVEFTEAASQTTVRDGLAQRILQVCGQEVPLLPCPSVFAPLSAQVEGGDGGYVALNYMAGGGHYDLTGPAPGRRRQWEEMFVRQAHRIAAHFPCRMVCHDPAEVAEARRLLPGFEISFSQDWRDYVGIYAGCRFALVNRVHAAMVTAAAGRPVVLVGNDSRMLTAELLPSIQTLAFLPSEERLTAAVKEGMSHTGFCDLPPFLQQVADQYLALLSPVLLP